ncbi:MAG: hypothetical protein KKF10_05390 [Verrucomicrobia bacterium]|nr:hypothetical protein [Verrucomicrobiota bacterium]
MNIERNQVICIFYSPDLMASPAKFTELVRESKAQGYGIVMGFFRHMKLNLLSPEVVECVRRSTRICHQHGLKYTLEMDATWWGYHLAERHPETALCVCRQGAGTAVRGRFEVVMSLPKIAMPYSQTTCTGLAAVFLSGKNGKPVHLDPAKLREMKIEYFLPMYGKKTYEDVQVHNFYRSGGGDSCVTITGQLPREYSGQVTLYAKFRDTSHAYVGHPKYLHLQKELLDLYKDIPLDGVGWDEAVRGADLESYKMGEGFFDLFRRKRGYRLTEKLIYLDAYENSPEAVRTRMDYFDLLSDVNLQAQAEFNAHARKLFGKDIILGIHQTWGGIACDLRAGCFPYFKLGKVLTDAYTDTCWMVPRETVYQNYLADSLRKELGLEKAYLNDWGGIETNELTNYYTRLKFLFKMNWVTMYMGIASEGLPNFPVTDVWPETGRCAALLDRFNAFLGQDLLPSADVAIWHGWEGIACLNNFFVRLYHGAISNIAMACLERNVHFDFVSSDPVDGCTTEKGFVRMGKRRYRTFVVPYACALRTRTFHKLQEMARAGVEVVFFGPPVQWEIDRRRDLSGEFAQMTGMAPLSLAAFSEYYRERKPVPDFATSWEPPAVDFVYPVQATTAEEIRDMNGNLFGIRKGTVTYLPVVDPREHLVDLLARRHGANIRLYSDSSFCRVHEGGGSKERVVVIVSRMNRTLDAVLKIGPDELFVRGGRWAAFRFQEGRITGSFCDHGVEATWRGIRVKNDIPRNN